MRLRNALVAAAALGCSTTNEPCIGWEPMADFQDTVPVRQARKYCDATIGRPPLDEDGARRYVVCMNGQGWERPTFGFTWEPMPGVQDPVPAPQAREYCDATIGRPQDDDDVAAIRDWYKRYPTCMNGQGWECVELAAPPLGASYCHPDL